MNITFKQTVREGNKKKITCIDWNANGLILATGSHDRDILIFKHSKNNLLTKLFQKMYLKGHKSPVVSLSFNSTDPNLIVSLSEKQVLLFWDIRKPKKPFIQHKLSLFINSMAWSKDGKILFFNDWNRILFIKKEQPKKMSNVIKIPWKTYYCNFARNDEIFIIAHDGFLNFYETSKLTTRSIKSPILTLHISTAQCKAVDINQTLNYLVTASSDGIISLWSTINLHCKNSFAFSKENFTINKIKISFNGEYIAFQGEEEKIIIVSKSDSEQIEIKFKITTKTKKTWINWNPKYNILAYVVSSIANKSGHNIKNDVCKLWAPVDWYL